MKIHIPNSAFLGNINAFIKTSDFKEDDFLYITANEKWMSVHPVVLCMIAALGVKVRANSKAVLPIRCERFTATSKHYFERMKLFEYLHLDSEMVIQEHESSGRFIPITNIRDSITLNRFITDMIPLLHLKEEHAKPIRYVISELVRNVLEHANTPHGAFVAAQYYKKTNTIRIGIVDSGIGILKSISQAHVAKSHKEAIKLALTPGVTGTTANEGGTDYNAGAGLFFSKSIAKINNDLFVVYSGNTLYKLLRDKSGQIQLFGDPFLDRHTLDEGLPLWQGTVVGIDLTLDENTGFTNLLDMIREVYTSTVRERRKTKYKKPKFI
jgi:anti-sigma regulatory factor (Ser/Thr protein kinase)